MPEQTKSQHQTQQERSSFGQNQSLRSNGPTGERIGRAGIVSNQPGRAPSKDEQRQDTDTDSPAARKSEAVRASDDIDAGAGPDGCGCAGETKGSADSSRPRTPVE